MNDALTIEAPTLHKGEFYDNCAECGGKFVNSNGMNYSALCPECWENTAPEGPSFESALWAKTAPPILDPYRRF